MLAAEVCEGVVNCVAVNKRCCTGWAQAVCFPVNSATA